MEMTMMGIINRLGQGRLVFALMSTVIAGTTNAAAVWTEGEDYTFHQPEADAAVDEKAPASGGKCLAGQAFRLKGHEVGYDIVVPEGMKSAVLEFRYARLHVMDWTAAPVRVILEGKGMRHESIERFDQTGGWGSNGANEWGLKTVQLGDMPAGTYRLLLRAAAEHCNLNLDGFLISEDSLAPHQSLLEELDRIHISDHGYWGLGIANTAVDQNAFPDVHIRSSFRGGDPGPFMVRLQSSDTDCAVELEESVHLKSGDRALEAIVPGKAFSGIADGQYSIEVTSALDGMQLSIPVVAMGDLYKKAAENAESYAAFEKQLLEQNPDVHSRAGADFLYAVDYIQNTLVLLRSKGGDSSDPAEVHKRALAYMEKSKNRSVGDFASDLRALIEQTDETIRRIESGDTTPYINRTGDFRRAFFSARTGEVKPYRVVVPDAFWKSKENKFLLTLHGGGGDENYYPENSQGGSFTEAANRLGYLYAAPRAVSRYRNGEEEDMKQLVEIIQSEYPGITPERTYCTGVSMGGFGTFNMVTTFPHLFKAAACVSSGGGRNLNDGSELMKQRLDNLKYTPVLILHGEIDSVVPVERATNFAKALESRGYVHEMEIYPGHGHAYYGALYLERTHQFFMSPEVSSASR